MGCRGGHAVPAVVITTCVGRFQTLGLAQPLPRLQQPHGEPAGPGSSTDLTDEQPREGGALSAAQLPAWSQSPGRFPNFRCQSIPGSPGPRVCGAGPAERKAWAPLEGARRLFLPCGTQGRPWVQTAQGSPTVTSSRPWFLRELGAQPGCCGHGAGETAQLPAWAPAALRPPSSAPQTVLLHEPFHRPFGQRGGRGGFTEEDRGIHEGQGQQATEPRSGSGSGSGSGRPAACPSTPALSASPRRPMLESRLTLSARRGLCHPHQLLWVSPALAMAGQCWPTRSLSPAPRSPKGPSPMADWPPRGRVRSSTRWPGCWPPSEPLHGYTRPPSHSLPPILAGV